MTPEKYEALRLQVKDLVHAEMHLLEGFFTKRVMLMLEYADSIGEPARAVPAASVTDAIARRMVAEYDAVLCGDPTATRTDGMRAALEAVWPKQPNAGNQR